jgi:hypothetical protein
MTLYEPIPNESFDTAFTQPTLIENVSSQIKKATISCLISISVIILMLGACILSYFYCKSCLVAIVIFSLFFCLCVPGLNVPLWIGIVLLIISGYSFTNGKMTLVWN